MLNRSAALGVVVEGEQHIPWDDDRQRRQAEQQHQWHAGDEEDVLDLVATPSPLLELQGKKRYLGHEHPTAEHDERQHDGQRERDVHELGATTHDERPPEQGVGRRGQSDERGGLALVEIELGQAEGREGGDDESHVGEDAAQAVEPLGVRQLVKEGEHHRGRGHTEGDVVGQRVEFLADGRRYPQQACAHAVEEVEDSAQDDEGQGPLLLALKGKARGDAA